MTTDAVCPACGAGALAPAFARALRAYVRCTACDSLAVMPRPSSGDVDGFYRQGYWEGFVASRGHPTLAERVESDRHYATFALWRDVMPLGVTGRLLDVGASTGAYVAAAREAGFAAEGVEPSDEARRVASERHGVELHPGVLETAPVTGPYDVIVARDVIEHVADPGAFARRVAELLAPGGRAVFETPTASSPGLRRAGSEWFLADPGMHLQILSERGAVRLLGRAGLEAVRISSPNEENMVVVSRPAAAGGGGGGGW